MIVYLRKPHKVPQKWGYDNPQSFFSVKHIQLKKEKSDNSVYRTKGKICKLISRNGKLQLWNNDND